jgi:histone H3/H4
MSESRVEPSDLVVKSKVRVIISEADMRVSDEIWNELGHTVTRKVKEAIRRAKANGRKTVKASDF